MKINFIKALIAFIISLLLGLLCYVIANEADSRNVISLITTSITIFVCMSSAFAIEYNCGHRDVNIKVSAWIFSVLVTITNFIFACFTYNIIVYVAVALLLSFIGVAIVALLYTQKK